jgi:type VI secretion system protein ImpE
MTLHPALLIQEGRLEEGLAALQAEVKARPLDAEKRFELGELLVLLGEWTRADNQLDLVSTQEPSFGVLVALMRQLIRGEAARKEVFEQGRAPELVGEVSGEVAAALRRLLDLRDPAVSAAEGPGDPAPLKGFVDGRPFEGVRDLDDRVADVLEVLTSTGKYFWIPWTRVRSIELQKPTRLRDLVWRQADLDVADGPSGVVYIPATYAAPQADMTGLSRLGRETTWVEEKGLTRGVGLRTLLIGDEDLSLSEFSALSFEEEEAA